jgi:ribosomal protein S8
MTNPLTIQLPPNLEQQMLHEAQKQNTTLERLVLGLIQKHYEVNPDINPENINSLEDFFNAIRSAKQTGHTTVQTHINDHYLQIAESLKRSGTLIDFQVLGQQLILNVNPHPPKYPANIKPLDIDPSTLDPDLAEIAKNLKHKDPEIRIQAIQDLVAWHER